MKYDISTKINTPDVQKGMMALRAYYDEVYKTYKVSYSFNEMLQILSSRKGQVAFIEGLGLGINASGLSDKSVTEAMKRLAISSKGKLPSKNQDFRNYLIDQATKIDFVDAIVTTAKETMSEIIQGTQAVGDSLIFTGKMLNYALPLIVAVVVFFWVKKQK